MKSSTTNAGIGIIALIVTIAALSVASSVFAPLAFAALVISVLWPVQARLQIFLPRIVAVLVSVMLLAAAFAVIGSLITWSFGRVVRATIADAAQFQGAYDQLTAWLDQHGIVVAPVWAEHFNMTWVIRVVQNVAARLNSAMAFWVVVLVYVVLGLLEVEDLKDRIRTIPNHAVGRILQVAGVETTQKLRRYMLVRGQMSFVTGVLVTVVAYISGLSLYTEWGVTAFVLNFIPFIGPLVATLAPTLFATAELGSLQAAAMVFIALNLVQFIIGSYLEPRVSGKALSLSPLLVLFSVFFWSYLWGIFGAFIGVPITLAMLTFAAHTQSTAWLAHLLGCAVAVDGDAAISFSSDRGAGD